MKSKNKEFSLLAAVIVVLSITASSCSENNDNSIQEINLDVPTSTSGSTVYASRNVYFVKSNGIYSAAEAASDFGNISGWDVDNAYIYNNICRILIDKDEVGGGSGMVSEIDVTDGNEYELEYKMKFHPNFEWSRGGKVSFGFKVGDGVTGCQGTSAQAGNGGSFRVMWYNQGSNDTEVYFYPYVYYAGMSGSCGSDFQNSRYPTTGALSKNYWYTIKLYFKANTGTNADGEAKMWVNGNLIFDQDDIKWSLTDAQRKVTGIYFSVFRGGSASYWESGTDGYVYFDDLKWNKLD